MFSCFFVLGGFKGLVLIYFLVLNSKLKHSTNKQKGPVMAGGNGKQKRQKPKPAQKPLPKARRPKNKLRVRTR